MNVPLILPPPEPPKKRTANVRLEEEIFENLKRYIAYSGRGDFSHVINNGMRFVFISDHGFQAWLAGHPTPITEPNKKKRHAKPLQPVEADGRDGAHRQAPVSLSFADTPSSIKGARAGDKS